MLGCLSLHAQSPERVPTTRHLEEEVSEENGDEGGEIGLIETNQGASTSGEQLSGEEPEPEQTLPNNASRRSYGQAANTNTNTGSGRRRSSLRSFCKKLGKLFSGFSRRSASSTTTTSTAYLGFDNRTRLRNEFRQRILGALSSTEPTFVTAGLHAGLRQDEEEIASVLRRRRLTDSVTRGEIISQSDQVWREIQDFAVSQQGDVYVYIPYTHLDEALSYLSQILPVLSLSLREHQKQEGLTREEFESLPVLEREEWEERESTSHSCGHLDCPVCFNPMAPEEELVALPCHEDHIFHKACLWKWLSSHQTCPLCRKKVETCATNKCEEEECTHLAHAAPSRALDQSSAASTASASTSQQSPSSNSSQALVSSSNSRNNASRRIFIWSTARSSTPAMLILSRGQR